MMEQIVEQIPPNHPISSPRSSHMSSSHPHLLITRPPGTDLFHPICSTG
jgi:hypothetical protein